MFIAHANGLSGAPSHSPNSAKSGSSSDSASRQAVKNGFSNALDSQMDVPANPGRASEAARGSKSSAQTDEDIGAVQPDADQPDAGDLAAVNREDSRVTATTQDDKTLPPDPAATGFLHIAVASAAPATGDSDIPHTPTSALRLTATVSERQISDGPFDADAFQKSGLSPVAANAFARNLDRAHHVANTMAALAKGQDENSTGADHPTRIRELFGSAGGGTAPASPKSKVLRLSSHRSLQAQALQQKTPATDDLSHRSKGPSQSSNGWLFADFEFGIVDRASYHTTFSRSGLATPNRDLSAPESGRDFESLAHHGLSGASRLAATPPVTLRSGHTVQPFGHPAWSQEIGRQVVSWASSLHGGDMHAELHLVPPDIGPLRVQLAIIDGVTTASFASAHAGVRAALELSMPQLHLAMAQAGVTLGHANVEDTQSGSGSTGTTAHDASQHGPGRQGGDSANDATSPRNEGSRSVSSAERQPRASQDRNPHRILDVFA